MLNSKSGFTIVELIIVVVVIAILAAISLVAYGNVQSRARDNIRYATAKNIMKALEMYKLHQGEYPRDGFVSTPADGCTNPDGWSYSWADSNGTWLSPLVESGVIDRVPAPPINDCSSFIRYMYFTPDAYGCAGERTSGGYALQVVGVEETFIPKDTVTGGVPGTWKTCPGSTLVWGVSPTLWLFSEDE